MGNVRGLERRSALMTCAATVAGLGASLGFSTPAMAQDSAAASPQAGQAPAGPATADADTSEIVVTAQKREERLIETPVPVSVLKGEQLSEANQLRIQDYYNKVPAVQFAREQNFQLIAIRGVVSGRAGNPTVGVMIDDVPYGSTTNLGGGNVIPDIDPSDLARIEVLRGPQGTLYGASSMGGLIKFVTVDPSTGAFSGRVQAGLSSVENGDGLGYDLRGSVNVPLSGNLAVRASAFFHHDAGFIDNPVRHLEGVNAQDVKGGRATLLWKPSDTVRLKLSALYQRTEGDGLYYVHVLPGLGDLEQNNRPDTGIYKREVQAYSADLRIDLGPMALTSLSGYNVNPNYSLFDYDAVFGGVTNGTFGVHGTDLITDITPKKFSQEVRLASTGENRLDWLVGAFFTKERTSYRQYINAINETTGAFVGEGVFLSFPTTLREYALFASATYHFSDQFDLQVGGRESWLKQTTEQEVRGPFTPILAGGLSSPAIFPRSTARSDTFTYSVTPRFRVTPNLMIYGRLATGYRPGGANLSPGGVAPVGYSPDRTTNYELGVKAALFGNRLTVDGSIYQIDWSNIQLQAVNPVSRISYNFNGSDARSRGMELSVESRPWTGATLGGWIALNQAKLTEDFPAAILASTYGVSGDRLPFSARTTWHASFNQDVPLAPGWTGFAGAELSYVGKRVGTFRGLAAGVPLPRQVYPDYTTLDLRAGVRSGDWTLTAYANNATDKRGIVSGGLGFTPAFAFSVIQPRTIGLNLSKEF